MRSVCVCVCVCVCLQSVGSPCSAPTVHGQCSLQSPPVNITICHKWLICICTVCVSRIFTLSSRPEPSWVSRVKLNTEETYWPRIWTPKWFRDMSGWANVTCTRTLSIHILQEHTHTHTHTHNQPNRAVTILHTHNHTHTLTHTHTHTHVYIYIYI